MARMKAAQVEEESDRLVENILRMVDQMDEIPPQVAKEAFSKLADAYATANFGFEECEGTMLALDQAEIVMAFIERLGQSLGEDFERLADHYALEEKYIPIKAGESAKDRAAHMTGRNNPHKALTIAKTMVIHSAKKHKDWWQEVVKEIEERIPKSY